MHPNCIFEIHKSCYSKKINWDGIPDCGKYDTAKKYFLDKNHDFRKVFGPKTTTSTKSTESTTTTSTNTISTTTTSTTTTSTTTTTAKTKKTVQLVQVQLSIGKPLGENLGTALTSWLMENNSTNFMAKHEKVPRNGTETRIKNQDVDTSNATMMSIAILLQLFFLL